MANGRTMTRVMRRLRAIRDYTDQPISDDDLDEILTVVRWTGSAGNEQPWRFVVIRDAGIRAALAELVPNAPQLGRAPVLLAVVLPGRKSVLDAYEEGRVTERILLAAAALGLAAAVGWIPQEARAQATELLGIPAERVLRSVVAIGHPAPEASRPRKAKGTARLPIGELVHRERWGARD